MLNGWSSVHCEPVVGGASGYVYVPTIEAVRQVAREEALKVVGESKDVPRKIVYDKHLLVERINSYLINGGLFNPEHMDHQYVQELLVDCREALLK